MTTTATSLRLPADLKAWIDARSILTHQSMNATIVGFLREFMDNDPLTALRIFEHRGRFVVASAYSGETFMSFTQKDSALNHARGVLTLNRANSLNIIDETEKEAA